MAKAKNHFIALDLVRGLAACSVFLTHWVGWTSLPEAPRSPWLALLQRICTKPIDLLWHGGGIHPGVIVFIVLSGMCIHLPTAQSPQRVSTEGFWPSYFRKRLIRIAPVYWTALLVGIGALAIVKYRFDAESLVLGTVPISIWSVLCALFLVSGITQFVFPRLDFHPGNSPLITVAVEILLYLSYPLILTQRRRRGAVFVFGIAVVLYSLYVGIVALGYSDFVAHGSYLQYLIYWIIGGASAEMLINMRAQSSLKLLFGACVGSLFIFLLYSYGVELRGSQVLKTLLFAIHIGTLLTLLLVLEQRYSFQQNFICRFFVKISERSYSLYAIHTPILGLCVVVAKTFSPSLIEDALALGSLSITAVATEMLYRMVERPCQTAAAKVVARSLAKAPMVPAAGSQ